MPQEAELKAKTNTSDSISVSIQGESRENEQGVGQSTLAQSIRDMETMVAMQ